MIITLSMMRVAKTAEDESSKKRKTKTSYQSETPLRSETANNTALSIHPL